MDHIRGQRLQAIKTIGERDHRPLVMHVNIALNYSKTLPAEQKFSQDLMLGVTKNFGRQEFASLITAKHEA